MKVNGQQVLLLQWQILLKLYRCYGHGLKICMLFGCNPQTIFGHFVFLHFELSHFVGIFSQPRTHMRHSGEMIE